MTDEQLADFAQIRKDNDAMRDQINTLTLYLRTRYPDDFTFGVHGQKQIAEITIHYLSRLVDAAKAPF